ncbi:MAG TPA: hypothetical protein VN540_04770 [Clostridia bacterium]|nr:hypothetical protein [Clostridia bacterium]
MANGIEVIKRFGLSLDISRPISNREFTLVEGDTGNELLIILTDDGEPVDLSGCRVMALFSKSDGATVSQDSGTENNGVSVGGGCNNEIAIRLFASSFAPGMVECEIQIYSGAALATLVTSAKFNFRCRRSILNADTIPAVPEYPLLTSLLAETQELSAEVAAASAAAQTALAQAEGGEVARNSAESARTVAENARSLAETARDAAEEARAGAELGRAAAETARAAGYAALEGRLDDAVDEADALLGVLEGAVEGLPEFASVAGILKGDGQGGVTAAGANGDYYEPPLRASNVAILTTDWNEDETYGEYPYRAAVPVPGALASMVPDIVFALADAVSGTLAPVVAAYAGGVYVYTAEVPENTVTVATLTLWKAVV